MKPHKVRKAPFAPACPPEHLLPRAVIVPEDQRGSFPKVWLVGSRDIILLDQPDAWQFDVMLEYRSCQHDCFDMPTTWGIVCPSYQNAQAPAIKLLRERAWCEGYRTVRVFDIRPPVTAEKREYLHGANRELKKLINEAAAPKCHPLGLVGAADCRS